MTEKKSDSQKDEKNSNGLINIELKVSDVLGLEKATGKLIKASENVFRSIEKGVGKLSKPMMQIIESAAEVKSDQIKEAAFQTAIKQRISLLKELDGVIPTAKSQQQNIDYLIERAVEKQTTDLCIKQLVKEKISGFVFKELPFVIEHDAQEVEDAIETIDEDWLELFWQTCGSKSSEEMQRIFARILAGECFSPGSYSPRLLHILSIMTPAEAKQFEVACTFSLSDGDYARIIEPVEEFENFLYTELEKLPDIDIFIIDDLQSLGLLGQQSIAVFSEDDDGLEIDIGGLPCQLKIVDSHQVVENQDCLTSITFTKAGEELRSLVAFKPNVSYQHNLSAFVKEYLGIEIIEI